MSKIATVKEALQLYKTITDETDLDKCITLSEVLATKRLKIKEGWDKEYLLNECVEFAALEVVQLDGPIDLTNTIIGVMDGTASSSTKNITINETLGDFVWGDAIDWETNENDLVISYSTKLEKVITCKGDSANTIAFPSTSATLVSPDGHSTTVYLTYSLTYNGSEWTSGTKTLSVGSQATIIMQITGFRVYANADNRKFHGKYCTIDSTISCARTYTSTNGSISYTYSAPLDGIFTHSGYPTSYNATTGIAGTTNINHSEVNIHLVRVVYRTSAQNPGHNRKEEPFPSTLIQHRILMRDFISDVTGTVKVKRIGIKNTIGGDSGFVYSTLKGDASNFGGPVGLTATIVSNSKIQAYAVLASTDQAEDIIDMDPNRYYLVKDSDTYQAVIGVHMEDRGTITPNIYPTSICSIYVELECQTSTSPVIKYFTINILYDPYVMDISKDEYTLTYTTTDSQKVSLTSSLGTSSGVASISTHNYSGGIGTVKYNTNYIPIRVISNGFKDKTTLKNITLPKNITKIETSGFQGCVNLQECYFDESVLHNIGTNAFAGCSNLGTIALDNYYDSLTVGDGAFENSGLRLFTIKPGGQEQVLLGERCFKSCSNLQQVSFNDSIQEIPAQSFYKCIKLTSIDPILEVQTIKTEAFRESGLVSLSVPSSSALTTIDSKAFYQCSNLQTVDLSGSKLTTIGANAFAFCSITDTNQTRFGLPESLVTIGDGAFIGNSFSRILIPKNLTTLGVQVFDQCSNLSIVDWQAIDCAKTWPFRGCESTIKRVYFSPYVQKIPAYAFGGCKSLQNANCSTSAESCNFSNMTALTHIGEGAFYECNNLEGSVVMPASLQEIGAKAFKNAYKITSVQLAGTNVNTIGEASFFGSGVTSFTLPAGSITSCIEAEAFCDCAQLSTVKISEKIKTIGRSAFRNCEKYTFKTSTYNPLLFLGSTNYIFDTVTEIHEHALHNTKWYNDQSTGKLMINSVFYGIKNSFQSAGNIDLDLSNVTCISGYTFHETAINDHGGAKFLQQLILPTVNCTYIGPKAFKGCVNAYLGNSSNTYQFKGIRHIGESAFEDCTWLFSETNSISFDSTLQSIDTAAFKSTTLWGCIVDFSSCFNYTIIKSELFKNSGIVRCVVPQALREVSDEAFRGCSYLNAFGTSSDIRSKNCTIPSNVSSIGTEAFEGCSAFSGEIYIPASVTSIGRQAFHNCKNATSIKIALSGDAISLGQGAFNNCKSVTTLYLPKRASVGKRAFYYCKGLSTVYYNGTTAEWDAFIQRQKDNNAENFQLYSGITVHTNQTW